MKPSVLPCPEAREQLSARLDGEPHGAAPLAAHLATCRACRAHGHALEALAGAFATLREPDPLPDLWARLEARAFPRPRVPLFARVAAALVGFLGLGTAALLLERDAARPLGQHFLERLAAGEGGPAAAELFAAVPEFHLLRNFPEEAR